ncbi:MAG: CDP-alcohol phosphatidyltransferase family protein, partial [Spirochaetales bacterium]|nr:CDP-alcohol phosphatidyltransferase family protein [Spirochaetales bacterium]
MSALNRANTLWLPSVSLLLFLYTSLLLSVKDAAAGVLMWTGPILALPLMGWGLALALKGSGIRFAAFFNRPANAVTLGRSVLLFAGLAIASISLADPQGAHQGLCVFSAVIIVLAFLADKADGFLARREQRRSQAAEFGPWYDAESDAIIILFAGVLAVRLELAPAVLLVAALSRYAFGLLFSFFPLPLVSTRWFALFSKIAAGFLQGVLGYVWAVALLFSGTHAPVHPSPSFFTDPAPVTAASYAISAIIFLSFAFEAGYRFRTFVSTLPPKYRKGLFRSFLIYYRIPFRYVRMVRFYGGFVTPGDTVFDVGAHLGNRIRAFRALGARVIAFEPQEACRKILETWFGNDKSVALDYSAVGKENGSIAISTSYNNPTLASVDGSWIAELKREPGF